MKRKATTYPNTAYKKPRATTQVLTIPRPMPSYRGAYNRPGDFKAMGPEVKCIDIPNGVSPFVTYAGGATITLLNGVQTGAGFFNRVGSRIEMKNLHLRGFISYNATQTEDFGRIIVVYDRQPTGALPTWTTMFQHRDQAGAATTSCTAEINLDNRDRFSILSDKMYWFPSFTYNAGVLTNGPNFPGSDQEMDINTFIKLKGLVTHFNSTANPCTIANIATGALYLITVSQNNSNSVNLTLGTRLRYKDA